MTLRQLELFISIAETGKIGTAAEKSGLTQSAVSMAISNLEDDIGEKLFDRINRRLILNENGRVFLRKIRPLVLGLDESRNMFRDDGLRGDLAIGVSTSIANYVLPEIIYDFTRKYEDVSIHMTSCNTRDVVTLIEKGEVDLGFVEGEVEHPDILKEILAEDELFVITSGRNSFPESCDIDELLERRWLLREEGSGTRDVFLSHLGSKALRLNVFMELGSEAIKSLLLKSDCLSCLSRHVVRNELARGELKRIDIEGYRFTRHFYTLRHRNKHDSAILREFTSFARETMGGFL